MLALGDETVKETWENEKEEEEVLRLDASS
jgi:hypothetical protein